jgi:hypothetical protein
MIGRDGKDLNGLALDCKKKEEVESGRGRAGEMRVEGNMEGE